MQHSHPDPKADVGVIIGRFQVAELHEGHHDMIRKVIDRHRKVIILLGIAPVANSINNPLDFESRKQMLMTDYPSLIVLYVKDINDDSAWSRQVDLTIGDVTSPTQSVLLYGSRDSFISSYVGRYDTYELPAHHDTSGSESREALGQEAKNSPEWRAGVIWASRNRFPVSYTAVDIAIFNEDYTRILLGRKPYEMEWRLIGGFTDPGSESLEEDAKREVLEEAGVTLDSIQYVASFAIDDWRYRNEPDCIKSALFVATTTGEPVAGDDIREVQWFPTHDVDPTNMWRVMKNHRPLVARAFLATHNKRTYE